MTQLFQLAQSRQHRFGLCLRGDQAWQETFCQIASNLANGECFQLGGVESQYSDRWCPMDKGQRLLGHECGLLVVDIQNGIDANSLTSLLGTLRGGGLAIFIQSHHELRNDDENDYAEQWFSRALQQLIVVKQQGALPVLPILQADLPTYSPFDMQQQAVGYIHKVVSGHRRRPLVLTADRGRGKTSALGIAAAQLMSERKIRIVVTSPVIGNVAPLFEHALRGLPGAQQSKFRLDWNSSSVEFVAPDELLRGHVDCDLLFVDEAAAIPLPMLITIVERYHRVVFATTIHGYEGCGRGFTLKFQSWLQENRPGTRFYHMDTPIRWAENDPLEQWQYQTFLLDCELPPLSFDDEVSIDLVEVSKSDLFTSPNILKQCFALLVNAHYQTTPNDLMLLLNDPAMKLFGLFNQEQCIGCIVGVEEGGLDIELAKQILLGKRRPKGHLVASSLVSHLALEQPALDLSLRIMRIAVHPEWQGRGVGSNLLKQLKQKSHYHFYSTSYGVTNELLTFWHSNGFRSIKLGSTRDQASGCHSLIMVDGQQDWIDCGESLFSSCLSYQLKEMYRHLDIGLVCSLAQLNPLSSSRLQQTELRLLENYAIGGCHYENVAPVIERALWQVGFSLCYSLLVRKVVQQWSWNDCAEEFNFTGRKQLESEVRLQVAQLLNQL
ncbi:GNAT family N-acetyltransferase [Vibrio marinisediminis]|uniref:GNAT family N-acetyltransferase n=1 Tax=Vibrio marinisediminis TaxID=2758441 RepID=UPI0034D1B3DF